MNWNFLKIIFSTRLPAETLAAPASLPGVVMITDTAFYRNPYYHQPTDTPETLD